MNIHLIDLYNAAADIVNFCYSQDGNWVGTENIRKSGKFLELVSTLREKCYAVEEKVMEIELQELSDDLS